MPVTGADQRQPVALRPVGPQRLSGQRPAQVVCQRRPHAHREHAGLLQRPCLQARDVAGGILRNVSVGYQVHTWQDVTQPGAELRRYGVISD